MRTHQDDKTGEERIAKRMARAGVCSRREAERLILAGRVAVNGKPLTSPAFNVTALDVVTVDGDAIEDKQPSRLWRYHKPAGLVTTARDPKGRPTVFGALPTELGRVISVGRLDLTSEGLLLLTNDGALARFMELPATGWIRRYRVRVFGPLDPDRLKALAQGITVDGIRYAGLEITVDSQKGDNAWLTVALTEGKNREIRKVMQAVGLTVNRLIRISYGPFQLGNLPRGAVEEVPKRVLKDQIGTRSGGAKTGETETKSTETKSTGKQTGGARTSARTGAGAGTGTGGTRRRAR